MRIAEVRRARDPYARDAERIDGSGRELSRKSLTYGIRLLNEANYHYYQIEHRQKQRLVQEVDPETVPAGPN